MQPAWSRLFYLFLASMLALSTPGPLYAQDTPDALKNAERTLIAAIRADNRRALGRSLAAKFTYTDAAGATHSKSEVMDNIRLVADWARNETEVAVKSYGPLIVMSGARNNKRFARIWVKRRLGWLLFLAVETPAATAASGALPPVKGDCENPCRTVRHRSATPQDAQVLAAWQSLETALWRGNADAAAKLLGEEFVRIGNSGLADRDQVLAAVRQAGQNASPGDPATFVRIHAFDTSAAMVTRQSPYRGGQPYYAARIWSLRDGRWQLVWMQRTTIEGAPPLPPVVRR